MIWGTIIFGNTHIVVCRLIEVGDDTRPLTDGKLSTMEFPPVAKRVYFWKWWIFWLSKCLFITVECSHPKMEYPTVLPLRYILNKNQGDLFTIHHPSTNSTI